MARHSWNRRDDHNATCRRCGTHAQKRPHPYGRRWWTEWHLPDGSYVNNYNGEPTPPCVVPAAQKAPEDARTGVSAEIPKR